MALTFEEAAARLTQPGGPFAIKTLLIEGIETQVFERTPESLRAMFDTARARR